MTSIKPRIIRIGVVIIALLICSVCSTEISKATVSKTIKGWKTIDLYDPDEYGDYYRKSSTVKFTVPRKCYIQVRYIITPYCFDYDEEAELGTVKRGRVKFSLKSGDKTLGWYAENMKGYEEVDKVKGWCYFETKCKPGTEYTLKMTSSGKVYNGYETGKAIYTVKYCIVGYSKMSTRASIKKKVNAKARNRWIKIGKFGEGLPHFKRISLGKRKVVDGWWIKNDGSIYIWVNKRGRATVTMTLYNGKKYKTRVVVK